MSTIVYKPFYTFWFQKGLLVSLSTIIIERLWNYVKTVREKRNVKLLNVRDKFFVYVMRGKVMSNFSRRKLVYCATPKRKAKLLDKIMLFVIEKGLAPLHPFLALPYKYFDDGDGYFQKDETMSYCLRLIQICDKVFVFGYSDGVEEEIAFAKKIGKKVIYINEMEEWKEYII